MNIKIGDKVRMSGFDMNGIFDDAIGEIVKFKWADRMSESMGWDPSSYQVKFAKAVVEMETNTKVWKVWFRYNNRDSSIKEVITK